jgi:RNA-binding protein
MDLPEAPDLTSSERKRLRGDAQRLKPAVLIGKGGASKTVIAAVETALDRNSLIKVRIEAPDRTTRKEWLAEISTATRSTICGEVGHTASIYRPKPTNP